jgi:hypothetical protein
MEVKITQVIVNEINNNFEYVKMYDGINVIEKK